MAINTAAIPLALRSEIARDLRDLRTIDRQKLNENVKRKQRGEIGNGWDRTGAGYARNLHGLKYFFSYLGQLPTHTWLDVGAGTTRGAWHLSESTWVKDQEIDPQLTALTNHPIIDDYFGRRGKVRITSAEVLRGIESNSIAGITAAYSADYSFHPQAVASRFYDVVIPGGIVKMSIFRESQMVEHLQAAGFEAAVYDATFNSNFQTKVVLARKPGGKNDIPLEELLTRDRKDYFNQAEYLNKLQRNLEAKPVI